MKSAEQTQEELLSEMDAAKEIHERATRAREYSNFQRSEQEESEAARIDAEARAANEELEGF